MAVIMAVVVVMAGRAAPSDLGVTTLAAADSGPDQVWSTVVEIMDPKPEFIPLSISRRPSRFVTLIPTDVRTTPPIPEVDIPATV
jgi:hypothetical protein